MKMASLLALVCLGAPLDAAQVSSQSAFLGSRDNTNDKTLLPGPYFLSPAGVSTPGHKWKSVGSSSGTLLFRPTQASATSAKQSEDVPPAQKGILFEVKPAPGAKPTPDLLRFNATLPQLKTALPGATGT